MKSDSQTARIGWPDLQTWLFVAMELSWIAAFLLLLDSGAGANVGPPFALIGLFYPLALLFDGSLQRLRPGHWQWIAGHAAAFALLLFLSFMALAPSIASDWRDTGFRPGWLVDDAGGRHGLIIIAGALFCWVRGLMLSGKRLSADAVALGFQIGLLVLLLVLAIGQGLERDQGALVWLGLAFVGFGLATLWHIRASAGGTNTGGTRLNPISAIAGIAAVLVVGLLASAIVDRSVLDVLLALVMRALEIAGAFLVWLFSFLPEPEPEPFDLPGTARRRRHAGCTAGTGAARPGLPAADLRDDVFRYDHRHRGNYPPGQSARPDRLAAQAAAPDAGARL